MSVFDEFDDAGFVELQPASKAVRKAELRIALIKIRSAERLTLTFASAVLDEIAGPRFDVAWNPQKRLLLVKAGPAARFEASTFVRGDGRRLMVPVPGGLAFSVQSCEPEFYVDAVGKRILIEVPVEFGRRLALPAPAPAAAARPVDPAIPPAEIEQGNREILRALGVTRQFPRQLGGQTFSPAQACILEALLKASEGLTQEALLAATHDPAKGDDDHTPTVVDVLISKMRPQLAALGITITGGGGRRRMDAASKAALRGLLAAS